jgi:protein TonB
MIFGLLLRSLFVCGQEKAVLDSIKPPADSVFSTQILQCPKDNANFIYDDSYLFDKAAEYTGGLKGLTDFIGNTMYYPQKAIKKNIQGKVVLKFVVEIDGTVSNISILKDPNELLSKEAIRVLKLTEHWIPAEKCGTSVRSYYRLPITFRLHN